MPARVQQLILGLGKAKQPNISTAAASFMRFKKLDMALTTPKPVFENDAAEIGKGHEFITQTSPRTTKSPTASKSTLAPSSSPGPVPTLSATSCKPARPRPIPTPSHPLI